MAIYDVPRERLRATQPRADVPSDLEQFWAAALAQDAAVPLAARFTRAASPLRTVESFDVEFYGACGDLVSGWLHLPAIRQLQLPCVVEYVGYGGGRGLVHERTLWASAGYAQLVMDTRGQGSAWTPGDTPDPRGSSPSHPGFLTRGLLDPAEYYYRRVYGDAVRAIEAARAHPEIDPTRIAVAGTSQGGGIALAAGALGRDVAAVLADVPFLCDIVRAAELTDQAPYSELARYLGIHRDHIERASATLSYFDAAVLGRLATAPALFSVALMDAVCPPQTVFAAFNTYAGPKSIEEYPYNDHEGGGPFHELRQLTWLDQQFGRNDCCPDMSSDASAASGSGARP